MRDCVEIGVGLNGILDFIYFYGFLYDFYVFCRKKIESLYDRYLV